MTHPRAIPGPTDCATALREPRAVNIGALAACARDASRRVALLPTGVKNGVLTTLASLLESHAAEVLRANAEDVARAREAGLPAPKLQRLGLSERSVGALAAGLRQVASLPDPVGRVTREGDVPSGLHVKKVRAPLGVVAMIYEARPGVTLDAFALCFKAGNACILRGGKEAERSNAVLADLAHRALDQHGAPREALVNISGTGRDVLAEMLQLDTLIDLVIPRGGRELIELVRRTTRIPTVQHFQGVCHIYVDESADLERAVEICATAKASAPATCNAAECVLVHKGIAEAFVPAMIDRYVKEGVQVRATPLVLALAPPHALDRPDGRGVVLAQPEDFGAEFLDLIVAMRTVDSVDEAIEHIAEYASDHTEAILTRDTGPGGAAERFVAGVRSSCVLVNASTRFNDGFQLGLGAEIGISTSRVHAYGPMGLEELTTQRWIVIGSGQTR
jgi:glutamate-5-semialdehyde dehydrogenase